MTDERIIAYLLKELPESDLERFEDECFAQESWPHQISSAEEDLIDAYLRKELTPERHQRFERNYLTTEARLERVRLAAALLRHVDEYHQAAETSVTLSQRERHWTDWFRAFWSGQTLALRAIMALLVAAIVIGVLWLYLIRTPSPRTFATLSLSPSVNEREEGYQLAKVRLPIKEDALKITLKLPGVSPPAAYYRVVLLDENGEARPLEIAEQDSQSISVVIPRAQLLRGQYALQVFMKRGDGAEQRAGDSYLFIVE